jgi:RNA polymerase sigma factor for flagellar operon FliA
LTEMVNKRKRDQQIMKYAPLVKNIVERFAMKLPDHIDKEDLINVGIIGLISALERFDKGRNVKFETYARFRIRGAILDELRSRDNLSRSARNKDAKLVNALTSLQKELGRQPTVEEISAHLGISLDDYYKMLDDAKGISILSSDDLPPNYCEKYGHYDVLKKIDENDPLSLITSNELKKELKKAIDVLPEKERMVLSLYYYEELTLREIGMVLELTESRICQIHSQAVLKLRGILKDLHHNGDLS